MRTKALFLAAALGMAGIVSSMAQVYSVNVVGYVNTTLVPGFNLVSNPLDAGDNNVASIMPAVDGLTVYKFADRVYQIAVYLEIFGEWEGAFDLAPGEGAFVLNPTAEDLVVTFVGEITDGTKTLPIPQGFSIASSIVPQSGALVSALGFPQADGDQVFKFNTASQVYETYTYLEIFGEWDPSEPVVGVGEAFFVNKPAPVSWTREFSVSGQ
jgi:hypothetical protein